jgi:hypothetical protein
MLTIDTRTTSVKELLAQLRSVPDRIVPYATATALTRAALAARDDLRLTMQSVFANPTAYTLNSMYVQPATAKSLSASVFVKNITSRNGTLPEDYLFPEVEGGGRKAKRAELAMRYSGWLPAGWIAVTTKAAAPLLDESGDLPGGTVRRILIAIGARNAASKRTQKAAAKEFFAIAPDQARGRLRAGVYRRDGRKAIPILRFTPVQARYASRLNFTGQAQKTAERVFPREFSIALSNMLQRGAGGGA